LDNGSLDQGLTTGLFCGKNGLKNSTSVLGFWGPNIGGGGLYDQATCTGPKTGLAATTETDQTSDKQCISWQIHDRGIFYFSLVAAPDQAASFHMLNIGWR
jgi:hypothetical protein